MLDPDISTAEAYRHLTHAETDPWAVDRRRFLQLVGLGVGVGAATGGVESVLGSFMPGASPSAWAAGPIGPHDGVLVVIGMHGGNDGLNTVVPYNDPLYHDQHGSLAIGGASTLALDGDVGLHPALTELKACWDRGELAIVDGIGYPDPDLSHFNSMAYWMAGRPHAIPTTGWLGRWLDGYLAGTKDLFAASHVGRGLPLHLVGEHQRGTAVPPSRPGFGADTDERSLAQYQALRDMRAGASGGWRPAVAQAFVDQLDLARKLSPVIPGDEDLPDVGIVAELEVAARLINANLGFRVVTTEFGDFDSHAGQPDQHPLRMEELNAGVRRFFQVLDPAWASRVVVMTYSEFGRTSYGNDGAGTDHGTAAPHFVFGRNVQGGRYGQRPTLAGLRRWDRMEHHVDFRSYYASILDGWMGGGSSEVLGGSFEDLQLFSMGPGEVPAGGGGLPPSIGVASRFVPITPTRVADTRVGTGTPPKGAIQPGRHVRVKVTDVAGIPATGVTAVAANVTAVDATSPMFFTVYPGSTARPSTSSINGGPGRPVPNLVVMGVGDDGCIEVFNSHGDTHCLVDVFGYFTTGTGDRFTPVSPNRLFDTRDGTGVRRGTVAHLEQVPIQVAGTAGVPSSGATAVVLNLTATAPTAGGFLRVSPSGEAVAPTSNVNFFAGDTVPNLVVCKLGADGKIVLDAAGGRVHALGDVFGYFGADGATLTTTYPNRVLDTRFGTGAPQRQVAPGSDVRLAVAGRGAVPASATAVVLNVAATNVQRPSFLTVWPDGEARPATSNLNLQPGQTIANLVVCRLGDDGAVSIANPVGACDVLADVTGYFTG